MCMAVSSKIQLVRGSEIPSANRNRTSKARRKHACNACGALFCHPAINPGYTTPIYGVRHMQERTSQSNKCAYAVPPPHLSPRVLDELELAGGRLGHVAQLLQALRLKLSSVLAGLVARLQGRQQRHSSSRRKYVLLIRRQGPAATPCCVHLSCTWFACAAHTGAQRRPSFRVTRLTVKYLNQPPHLVVCVPALEVVHVALQAVLGVFTPPLLPVVLARLLGRLVPAARQAAEPARLIVRCMLLIGGRRGQRGAGQKGAASASAPAARAQPAGNTLCTNPHPGCYTTACQLEQHMHACTACRMRLSRQYIQHGSPLLARTCCKRKSLQCARRAPTRCRCTASRTRACTGCM